jgi:hypothetical protein
MGGRPEYLGFLQSVRIYDLVWYGEYNIDSEIYELIRPELERFYQSLEPRNER